MAVICGTFVFVPLSRFAADISGHTEVVLMDAPSSALDPRDEHR
jgi:ABC-type phosphate transport system ATPase subunit